MGQLPTIKRFLAEDFTTEASWIGNLLYPLNLLLNTIYANLNNGLTLKDNIMAQVKVLPVSGATPTTSFPWKYSTAPIGISVISCYLTDVTPTPILSAVTCDWSFSSGIVSINNVTGLNTAHAYSCTFIAWGG